MNLTDEQRLQCEYNKGYYESVQQLIKEIEYEDWYGDEGNELKDSGSIYLTATQWIDIKLRWLSK